MNYKGTIIEESLEDKSVLSEVKILTQEIERVTDKHKTPWLKQWTLDKVEISEEQATTIAQEIAKALDSNHQHSWYADYKNDQVHYIIFRNKIFRVDQNSKQQYDEAKNYGLSLGIPSYQVDFHPNIAQWEK